jgi:hypothetical protein
VEGLRRTISWLMDKPSGGSVSVSDNHARRRCARVLALAAAFLCFLVAAPAAGAAVRLVSTAGSDTGNCLAVPCHSMAYAYSHAGAGDTIAVAAGRYGEQRIPRGSKAVRFQGAGAVLHGLDNEADNVTFAGLAIDMGYDKAPGFHNGGASNVTFRDGTIGRVTDEKGALITGRNFTFDNVIFHDVLVTADEVHNECVYALDVTGMTVRNSHFYNCATMDLFFTYGTWWNPLPPPYTDVTIENNVFEHSTRPNPGEWHYYSLYIGWTGDGGGPLKNWKVRYNTFEIAANVDEDHGTATGSEWVGNLGGWNCVHGMAYRDNVGHKCGATDKQVDPETSSRGRTAPFGWINPAAHDFRLKPGSPAINVGSAGDAPGTDRRGMRRDSRPDAGALEFGNGAGVGLPTGSALGIRFARLQPKVICKRPRKGCPGRTRLRVGLTTGARVSVRVKRLRKGHRAKRVRAFGFRVAGKGARRIKASKLRKGRYRVVVRAGLGGLETPARALRLRVR